MGILSQKPAAATLTARLGAVLAEINRLRVDIAALSESATTDADHHRLNVMRSRLDSARVKETKLRAEIADAVAAERLVEQDAAFDHAETIGSEVKEDGAELRADIARLWQTAKRLLA